MGSFVIKSRNVHEITSTVESDTFSPLQKERAKTTDAKFISCAFRSYPDAEQEACHKPHDECGMTLDRNHLKLIYRSGS